MIITLASFKGGVAKTASAIRIACYLSQLAGTLLVDGDPNRSATGWAKRGALPFKVVDLMQAPMHSRNYEHVVIDTAARPSREDLEALADGCNYTCLLVLISRYLSNYGRNAYLAAALSAKVVKGVRP